ncbi:Transposon TX1 uncharacterized 149 kDa protein [Frankliniella fusca]|uniref:Transposon TX1 uncharacterized 149 kDa protein n=1 Tax=Frankliniella fusca TaxID=407009 RepID=A0AAE1I3H0_9NEOP|nr:Transposon TX1 uncharacterized 149 kDa protein [Frankliniella fusca]
MPEFASLTTLVTTRETPPGPNSLFEAVAFALRPDDPGQAVVWRGRELRMTALHYLQAHSARYADVLRDFWFFRGRAELPEDPVAEALRLLGDPGTHAGMESLQALAAALARPLRVLRPGVAALDVVPPAFCPGGRVRPVTVAALLEEEAGGAQYHHFDAVLHEAPLVHRLDRDDLEEEGGRLPVPLSPPILASAAATARARRAAMLVRGGQGCSQGRGALSPRAGQLGSATSTTASLGVSLPPPLRRVTPVADGRPGIRVATWNVQGCSTAEAMGDLDATLLAEDVHLAILQETRLPAQVTHTANYRWVVEGTPRRGHRSVAILVRRGVPDTRLDTYSFPHRDLVRADVVLRGLPFSVLGVHVPCDTSPRQRGVLAAMAAVVATMPRDRWRLLLGDFNGHIGREDVPVCRQVGTRLLHRLSNAAGVALVQVAQQAGLPLLTTTATAYNCEVTWERGDQRSQLDHVLSDLPRFREARALCPAAPRSDHRLVVAAFTLPTTLPFLPGGGRAPPQVAPRAPGPRWQDWALRRLHADEALRERYSTTLQAALLALAEHFPRPLSWQQLANALETAATEVLRVPASPSTPRRLAAANLRNAALAARRRAGGALFADDNLRRANAVHQAAVNQHAEERRAREFAAVEGVRPVERLNVVYRHLRLAGRRRLGPPAANITLRDWEEEVTRLEQGEELPWWPEVPDARAPAPTAAQLREYAGQLSNNTAPGPDGLPAELYKFAPALFFTLLAELVLQFWGDGRFPRAWITSVQVPLPKKARPAGVEDYRTLTLGCVLSKLLARHLYVLLRAILPPLPWYQAGFQPGRSTYDHIMLLRKVLDERWRAGDPVYVLALDIKAAFPSVLRRELAEVLLADGVPPFLLNRLVALALSDATSIRWQAGRTREVLTRRGVKQGCPLAPYLFTLALHAVLRRVVAALPRFRLDLDGADFNPLVCAYADDLLVASTRYEDVSRFLEEFAPRALELGLALNFSKCEYMERLPGAVDPGPLPRPVQVADREVQQVAKIVYLGALLTAGLERRGVAYHRVVKAQRAVATLQPLLHRNPLPPAVVSRIYRTTVLASLSYESSTATTKATRMTLRRQAGVMTGALMASARRPQRGLVRMVGEERRKASITRAIRGARVRYWGHILRCPPAHPLRRVLQFEVGRKKVGRPCHTFNTALAADLARLPAPEGDWEALARDKLGLAAHVRAALEEDVSSEDAETSEEEDGVGGGMVALPPLEPASEEEGEV